MSSVQIHIQGKILEIDKQIYFSTLQGMSKLIPWLAHQVCEDHRYGSINANGSRQTKSLQSKDETYRALLDAIKDQRLRKSFDKLELLEEKIVYQDAKMIKWLAAYYHISSLNSLQERKNFNRKLSTERRKAIDSGTGLLAWTKEPEWLELEIEFLRIITSIQSIVLKIAERTARLQ